MFEESGLFMLNNPILTPEDLRQVVGLMLKGALLSPCTIDIEITDSLATLKVEFVTHKQTKRIAISGVDLFEVARSIQRQVQSVAETNEAYKNLINDLRFDPDKAHMPVGPLDMEGCAAIVGPCKYQENTGVFYGRVSITDQQKRVCKGTKGNKQGLSVNFHWGNNAIHGETLNAVKTAVRTRLLPEPFIGPILEFLKENQLDFIKKLTKRPLSTTKIGEYEQVRVEVCKIEIKRALSTEVANDSKQLIAFLRKRHKRTPVKTKLKVLPVTEAEAANPDFLPSLLITVGQNKKKYFCQGPDGTTLFTVSNMRSKALNGVVDPDEEFLRIKIEKTLEKHGI
jgi:hypothetical protein